MEESSKKVKVKGVIGDEAYDSRRNFNILDGKDMEPIIKVRRNAVKKAGGDAQKASLNRAEMRLRVVEAEVWLKVDS